MSACGQSPATKAMLIDTHCHLDAAEFDPDRNAVVQSALDRGVGMLVIPAVRRPNLSHVAALAGQHACCAYALGIHPLYVHNSTSHDLLELRRLLAAGSAVAVGEIGLDFFVADYNRAQQEHFFTEQLKLAQDFGLPVILHVR